MTTTPYLLDQLETADMLLIDGLHAWQFELNESLLDQADAAAHADQPFASDEMVLRIESIDGRDRREWRFTYNEVMEARYQSEEESWLVHAGGQEHRLCCLGAVSASGDDE
ncbi:DUF5629 family protein [Pseudomonas sp. ZM23]|uniref:DUF5629 family protein n=1 Tax=Pseudomonas triclosanedens TaxID=2961893 RepID=A0ABY6ZUJ8_9PSED|nr:DUF5629 family protein [Pseudomonas triclosanedens]MCP8463399.1 DUF5629 family protein [Pseudomonas triclosanedens]MCP8469542.1 DUF5629 family protein [Pseudomonas triclosanedens]MCP8474200.1 DUF5629 family protein [Pseudomonas triclosanedens]WAI48410.1 DUF5629 family protein [Pseudomonas triclosanedens]